MQSIKKVLSSVKEKSMAPTLQMACIQKGLKVSFPRIFSSLSDIVLRGNHLFLRFKETSSRYHFYLNYQFFLKTLNIFLKKENASSFFIGKVVLL